MSAKSDLDRIEKRLGGDAIVISAIEQFDDRGIFKVWCERDELGLLTREELYEKFGDREDVELVILEYVDNWRGDDEREE